MSVNRGSLSPPWWVRYMEGRNPSTGESEVTLTDWGVIGFRVRDIPAKLMDKGIFTYEFRVHHVPVKNNYAHSEVRAFEVDPSVPDDIGNRLAGATFQERVDRILHVRWRENLLRKTRVFLRPGQDHRKDAG